MKTLNQVKDIIKAFFENHAQIQAVTLLDNFEFEAERNLIYPVTNIEYLNSIINTRITTHTFLIKIGSIAADRVEYQDEIISDSLLIADDFLSYIENVFGLIVNKSSISIEPFKESGGDRVAGVFFRIGLGQVRPHNNCQTPTK